MPPANPLDDSCTVDSLSVVPALPRRKYHDGRTAQARPEVYSAEKLAEDKFQSTVTIPPMGPRVYQGEVRERQNLAEQSAAKAFFEHPDNQYELENLEPGRRRPGSVQHDQRMRHRKRMWLERQAFNARDRNQTPAAKP